MIERGEMISIPARVGLILAALMIGFVSVVGIVRVLDVLSECRIESNHRAELQDERLRLEIKYLKKELEEIP